MTISAAVIIALLVVIAIIIVAYLNRPQRRAAGLFDIVNNGLELAAG